MTAEPSDFTPDYPLRIEAWLGFLKGEGYMLDMSFRKNGRLTDFEMDRIDMVIDTCQHIKQARAAMEESEATR